jgi:hypothetical protein
VRSSREGVESAPACAAVTRNIWRISEFPFYQLHYPEVQKMKKILLASVAVIPLLSISVLPAPAQQLREKSGSSMSQSQGGDEARDKSSAKDRAGPIAVAKAPPG